MAPAVAGGAALGLDLGQPCVQLRLTGLHLGDAVGDEVRHLGVAGRLRLGLAGLGLGHAGVDLGLQGLDAGLDLGGL